MIVLARSQSSFVFKANSSMVGGFLGPRQRLVANVLATVPESRCLHLKTHSHRPQGAREKVENWVLGGLSSRTASVTRWLVTVGKSLKTLRLLFLHRQNGVCDSRQDYDTEEAEEESSIACLVERPRGIMVGCSWVKSQPCCLVMSHWAGFFTCT